MRVSSLKARDSMTRVSPGSTISVEGRVLMYIHKEQMLDDGSGVIPRIITSWSTISCAF